MTLSPDAPRGRAGAPAALLILAALTLLLVLPAVGSDSVLYFRDVSQNHHPYRHLTVSLIGNGEAPLWNPYRGAGQPLLANPNALVLHPTTLLFLFLPLHAAMKASFALQILLAGWATWLLLRDMGASRAGSLLGAAAFAFSGFMVSLGNLLNLLNAAAFMPLTLWLACRALRRGFAPWGALAACSLAVQLLAGEPAVVACTLMALLPLHWSFPADPARRSTGGRLVTFSGMILLAIGVAMVGLLPTIELLARSERGGGFDTGEALKWSLPIATLPAIAFPDLFGDPTRIGVTNHWAGGLHDAGLPLILSIHMGGAVLLLAIVGCAAGIRGAGRRRREATALAAIAAAGCVLAIGRFLPVYPFLLAVIGPLESVRYPVKYLLLTTWIVPLLAARGYDVSVSREHRRFVFVVGGGALLLLAVVAVAIMIAPTSWLRIPPALATPPALAMVKRGMLTSLSLGLLPAAAVWALVRGAGGRARRAVSLGLVAIPVASLLIPATQVNPVAPRSFYDETPMVEALLGEPDPAHRFWAAPRPGGFAYRTPMEWDADSLRWGFRWDRMTLRNATYFTTGRRFAFDRGNERLDVMPGALLGRMLYDSAGGSGLTPEELRLLSLAGVDRIIAYEEVAGAGMSVHAEMTGQSNPPVHILRNDQALPRAYVVHQVEIRPDDRQAMHRLLSPAFDIRHTAVLDDGPAPGGDVIPAGGAQSSARIVEESANRVKLSASLGRPGYLVLCDTWYPGWIAQVDGVDVPIRRANVLFRAVALESGDHEIEFRYRPASVRSGLMVSLGAFLCAGILARPRRM